jgi:replication factor A1
VSKSFLQEQKNPIRDSLGTRFAGRCSTRKDRGPASLHIRDLRNGMKQISLKAKILEIPEPRMVYTRFGNYATVSNALIEDETGTIKLCLWNEQITSVAIGDTVFIENASMSRFKGESQLKIGRKGKLSNVNQPCTQMEALAQDKS